MPASSSSAAPAAGAARAWAQRASALAPALVVLLVMLAFHPFREVFEFDPDEGINLMKARLLSDGHRLYAEVWSDQPPGFTYMLAGWLGLTGWTVEHGRLLVLLCSVVLLAALGHVARSTGGNASGLSAGVLLAGSLGYLRLSGSVMPAVPSLMFAMLSVCMALHYRTHRHRAWLLASALCMALALLVKLWSALLVPVVLLALLADPVAGRRKNLALWAGTFGVTALALFLTTVPLSQAAQLVSPHLGARHAAGHRHAEAFWGHFAADAGLVMLATAGAVAAVVRRRWLGLLPAAWALLALGVFAVHKPLGYQHYLLVSIPLCWSGAQAVAAFASYQWLKTIGQARGSLRRWLGSVRRAFPAWGPALAGLAGAGPFLGNVPEIYRREFVAWREADERRDWHVLEIMTGLAPRTRIVFTDRQIVPFRAGLRVPGILAATSLARSLSGNMDEAHLVSLLRVERPEQVLLGTGRIKMSRDLFKAIDAGYVLLYHDHSAGGLLVRKDLAQSGLEVLVQAAVRLPDVWEVQLNFANRLREAGRDAEAMIAYRGALKALPQSDNYQPLRKDLLRLTKANGRSGTMD